MKKGVFLFLFLILFSGCGCGESNEEKTCCGKVVFTLSVSDGKETRMKDCGSDEKLKFCFLIENIRFIPFDKLCKTKNVETTYIASYGDGTTEVVSPNREFCYYFPEGNFQISVASFPEIKGCDAPAPFTSVVQIGVVECPYPVVKYLTNTCCVESWCELNVGGGCDFHIEATDIYTQPLTYYWVEERNGEKIFEEYSSYHTRNFMFLETGKYRIGGSVYNACGCSRNTPDNIMEVFPYVESMTSAITVELGVSDVYPQRITDDLFIYLSTSASRWVPAIGKVPKSPSIMIYQAPVTEPWKMELIHVYHGDESKGELQFSDNGYLHMNGEGAGVYVFAATNTFIFNPISSRWNDINSIPFTPSQIYVEGITGFLIEEGAAYSVNLSNPMDIRETDRIVEVTGCGTPKYVFSLLPFAFLSPEMITDPNCGIGVYNYDLLNFRFGEYPYENPPPELLLGIPNCSSTNYCMVAGMSGRKEERVENEFLVPVTYPPSLTAVLTLSLFSTGRKEDVEIFCNGTTTFKLDGSHYDFFDRKRVILKDWFYENYQYPSWTYSATYTVPAILFAGVNRMFNYDYAGELRMWEIKRYNSSITSELSSGITLLNDIGAFTSFSKLKVLTCDAPVPGLEPFQYLELLDFSDPYYPKSLTSFEIMRNFGFSGCIRLRGYEAENTRTGFVITGAELGVVDFSDFQNPDMKKILFFSGKLIDLIEYPKDSEIYLILSIEKSGIMIYDVTDINDPYFISSFQDGKNYGKFVLSNDILYALADDGIEIISLENISYPAPLTFFRPPDYMSCIMKEGNYLYAAGTGNLRKIDVSNPSSPQEIGVLSLEDAQDCAIDNGLIVILSESGRLYLFRAEPFESLGELTLSAVGTLPKSIYLKNGILFIGSRGYLIIHDISSPSSPVLLSSTFIGSEYYQVYDIFLLNQYLFLAVDDVSIYGTDKGFGYVYDVSDPTIPLKYAKFNAYDVNKIFVRKEGGVYYIYLGSPPHNVIEMFRAFF